MPALALPDSALAVGNTPLLDLTPLLPARCRGLTLHAKAEWHNPGGSVKDRPALRIIREAEAAGALGPGRTLLDATSGNTGIAYAWICSRLGHPVRLAVPAAISPRRLAILKAYGADVVLTDPMEGSDGAIREARRLAQAEPERYFYADQYANDANWRAHHDTTAVEIFEQTGGRLTHFVAGLGTSGTFMGTTRRLRALCPGLRACSVEPAEPLHGLEGLKHMATALVPAIYDPAAADERLVVATEDAQETVRATARRHGLLLGPSGGANVAAAISLAVRLAHEGTEGRLVTILPDSGERYLDDRFWSRA